jgi:hypothetical protein
MKVELSMYIRSLAVALVGAAGFSLAAYAQKPSDTTSKPAVLVELFTSEGCSSCPPADAVLAELDRRKSFAGVPIVVLSEHVDYWDHDGWRDPFSSAQWTARQNSYGDRFRLDSVYTPQMIVNGDQQVLGSDGIQIAHAIEKAGQQDKVTLEITNTAWSGDSLQATVSVTNISDAATRGTNLYAVLADDADASDVSGGENSGRRLRHVAVVRVMRKVTKLQGPYNGQLQIALPRGVTHGKMRLIVFAQQGDNGQVFGAAEHDV